MMTLTNISRRILQSLFVLWLAVTLAFLLMKLTPGDPAQTLLAASGASREEIAQRRAELGLDDPLFVQYGRYLLELLRGDLGESWLHGRPVGRVIGEQLPSTVELALSAGTVGALLGAALGTVAAIRRNTWLDTLVTTVSAVSLSTPTYWSGVLAILAFSLTLGWFPATGEGSLAQLVLPTLVLGFALSGSVARVVRARMVEVMDEPFVYAARARGLRTWRIVLAHILRPALPTALTVVALQMGFLLGGAVVTESVFARRGIGRLAVEAIEWQDLPVVRGVILIGALAYVLVNLAVDLAQVGLDPRLRRPSR